RRSVFDVAAWADAVRQMPLRIPVAMIFRFELVVPTTTALLIVCPEWMRTVSPRGTRARLEVFSFVGDLLGRKLATHSRLSQGRGPPHAPPDPTLNTLDCALNDSPLDAANQSVIRSFYANQAKCDPRVRRHGASGGVRRSHGLFRLLRDLGR